MDANEQPPRKPRGPGWRSMLTVVGWVVGWVALFVVFLVVGELLFFRGHHGVRRSTLDCANRLHQIGGIVCSDVLENGAYPTAGGAQLLFEYRRKHLIQAGSEAVLTCPSDPDVHVPQGSTGSAIYDSVDVSAPAALAPLCSYAVRDFARYPVAPDGTDPATGAVAWIACDRQGENGHTPHHEGGLNVLFADGAVQFRDRVSLGIAPGDPIIVGPGSPHPELQKLVFVPRDNTPPKRR